MTIATAQPLNHRKGTHQSLLPEQMREVGQCRHNCSTDKKEINNCFAVEGSKMNLFSKLSNISRRQKMELFNRIIMPTENMSVLDVGAEIATSCVEGLQFIDLYPWKNRISAINLSASHVSSIKIQYPEIEAVVGDACELPWPDKSFDVVYSNAVIEHLGSLNKQQKMAAEIMRVGKRWFVMTPNRWYPFEFHMRLPFVTLLPGRGYLWAGRIVAYNHVKRKYALANRRRNDLRLMTTRDLKRCFAGSRIIKLRVTFMAETLIVVGGDEWPK